MSSATEREEILAHDFFHAAKVGDLDKILHLLEGRPDLVHKSRPFEEYKDRVSAIQIASRNGHINCVQKLLAMDVDVNELTQYFTRALVSACCRNDAPSLQILGRSLYKNESDDFTGDKLIGFVERGEFQSVHHLLSTVYSELTAHDRGVDLLCYLILSGCPCQNLEPLVDQGVDVDGYNRQGFTPLISAVVARNLECINFLIKKGANINKPENVISVNDTECVWVEKELKFTQRFPNDVVLNSDGKTVLHYAVWAGENDIVKELLRMKARVNECDSRNKPPLSHSMFAGHVDIFKYLLSHGAITNYPFQEFGVNFHLLINPWHCQAILSDAIEAGNVPFLKILLTSESSVHYGIDNKNRALMLAAELGSLDCIRFLLDAGADINAKDTNGDTVVDKAARHSNLKCVKIFTEEYVDKWNLPESITAKALNSAAKNEDSEVLQFFLRTCEDVNAWNSKGETPLIVAASSNRVTNAKLLLEHGADVNLVPNHSDLYSAYYHHRSAIWHAMYKSSSSMLELLLAAGADISEGSEVYPAILQACRAVDKNVLRLILETGIYRINDQFSNSGSTPLCTAVRARKRENVRLLMSLGADVNVAEKRGGTPLMAAAKASHSGIFQDLLDAGADVDAISDGGLTVFDFAFDSSWQCLEILLKGGYLLDGNKKLKSMHKDCVTRYESFRFPARSTMLLFEYDVFDWSWYERDHQQLEAIVLAAVISGKSPCMFKMGNGGRTSLLQEAFLVGNSPAVRYLLGNLFFTVEDYKTIITDWDFQKMVAEKRDCTTMSLLNQVTEEPWRLETLSFLTISTSLALSHKEGQRRSELVDVLPLPNLFKPILSFETPISKVCFNLWPQIGVPLDRAVPEESLLHLFMPTYPMTENMVRHKLCCRKCHGLCYGARGPSHGLPSHFHLNELSPHRHTYKYFNSHF